MGATARPTSIVLLYFELTLTPASSLPIGSFPHIRPNCPSLIALFLLINYSIKNCTPKCFPDCLCYTGSVKICFYCKNLFEIPSIVFGSADFKSSATILFHPNPQMLRYSESFSISFVF